MTEAKKVTNKEKEGEQVAKKKTEVLLVLISLNGPMAGAESLKSES